MAMITLKMPALPDPVQVVLKPATTALLIFDVVGPICEKQPICNEVMVPALVSLLTRGVRKAGVPVLYSTRASPTFPSGCQRLLPLRTNRWLSPLVRTDSTAPTSTRCSRPKGLTTVILTGWKVSGSVVYTSVGATLRGYTVVVPTDAKLSRDRLRSRHRPIPNIESEQRQRRERAVETESLDLEPLGSDHVSIDRLRRSRLAEARSPRPS